MDQYQFYPTPKALALKAWSLFERKEFGRFLEPSAGRGHLLSAVTELERYRWRPPFNRVDVIEINLENHPILREKGYHVVDVDFLQHRSSIAYDGIFMNPPFRNGVDHVLHAWDLLKDGELVAIINAETVRNPNSAKRQHLVKLIETHGQVKFVSSAFEDPDTLRKTSVEVALVHLKKETKIELPSLTDLMQEDDGAAVQVSDAPLNELAIPNSSIKNTVRVFNAAVEAMKRACIAEATANYYSSLIKVEKPSDELPPQGDETNNNGEAPKIRFGNLRRTINERYDTLKENAWRAVLTTTDFTSRFSNKVREDIERKLNELTCMAFTVQNVYALLEGLIESKSELDMQMLEEIFDKICEYKTDGNRSYYKGWKSNDAHVLGWKIKRRRFILPNMAASFTREVSWEATRLLEDIDRAFAFLDGKSQPVYSMCHAIEHNKALVNSSQRVQSDYFDFRFFPGAGTMHFFPRRQDLLDRLNLLVGKRRQWIPDNFEDAPDSFRQQYEHSDKVTRKMDSILNGSWRARHDEKECLKAYEEARESVGLPDWNALDWESSRPQLTLLEPDKDVA